MANSRLVAQHPTLNVQRRMFGVPPFAVTACGSENIVSGTSMTAKTEKELSETQRNLWLKAVTAIELRNLGYAISLLQEILKQEPEFLTGRQLLRRTEVTRGKSAKKSFFNISTASITVMRAQRKIKNDPKHAVEMLEKILEKEPYNRQANLVLQNAAVTAG